MFDMKMTTMVKLPEVKIFSPSTFVDKRGKMWTTFDKKKYAEYLPDGLEFNHYKFTWSNPSVLRGLHGDPVTWKMVSCPVGEFYLIVADNRKDSPTYGAWEAVYCRETNLAQVLIPPGYVNGHYVTSKNGCLFHYAQSYPDNYVDSDGQETIKYYDKFFKFAWPFSTYGHPILSRRDE